MKEVLLRIARVDTEMLHRPLLQLRAFDPLPVMLAQDSLDPHIDGKSPPLARTEEQSAVGDFFSYPVELHQALPGTTKGGLALNRVQIDPARPDGNSGKVEGFCAIAKGTLTKRLFTGGREDGGLGVGVKTSGPRIGGRLRSAAAASWK